MTMFYYQNENYYQNEKKNDFILSKHYLNTIVLLLGFSVSWVW